MDDPSEYWAGGLHGEACEFTSQRSVPDALIGKAKCYFTSVESRCGAVEGIRHHKPGTPHRHGEATAGALTQVLPLHP